MILGVIFLGISLRNKEKPVFVEDAELGNFLSSTLKYTTDCYKDHDSDFKTLEELASMCYLGTTVNCPNGKTSCKVLEEDFKALLEVYKPAGIVQYSYLSMLYNDSSKHERFLNLSLGNQTLCSSKRATRQEIDASKGSIIAELEVCLNNKN